MNYHWIIDAYLHEEIGYWSVETTIAFHLFVDEV